MRFFDLIKEYRITFLLVFTILIGSLFGLFFQNISSLISNYLDITILALIFFIFLEVPFENLLKMKKFSFISITWITNFILIPVIGFFIAYIFVGSQAALLIGLFIYFMAPCTDWFLAFTKISKGDIATGTALIPINMISQLVLYPLYIFIFLREVVEVSISNISSTLFNWFILPFGIAILLHFVIKKTVKIKTYEKLQNINSNIIEGILAVLVFIIFSANIQTILENISWFLIILLAVFFFFVVIYFITEKISKRFKLSYSERALYTITTSARNAPLMLGITIAAFPNQPLVYAALIIGMLVEFPHLTIISALLKKSRNR